MCNEEYYRIAFTDHIYRGWKVNTTIRGIDEDYKIYPTIWFGQKMIIKKEGEE
jgi:hypothetical protein